MLYEGMIVIPVNDNNGDSLAVVSEETQLALAHQFGGVTVIPGIGKWIDSTGKLFAEPINELVTAYEPTLENNSKLRKIALKMGLDAGQLSVYVRYASGGVEIINIDREFRNVA
jgi:hypothetical protein